MDRRPLLPIYGATNGTPYKGTPPGFAPIQALANFRTFGTTDRPRGGKRAGARIISRQLKAAPVQAVATITRASAVVGQAVGTCAQIGQATSLLSTSLVGQIAGLDDVPSMDWFQYLNVTGAGGPADNAVQTCAYDPDGEFLAVASNYNVGSDGNYTLVRYTLGGTLVWVVHSANSGHTQSVNDIVVTKLYTFVALANTAAGAGPKVKAYRNDTGALAWSSDLNGWAKEAVALARYANAAGQEYVYVAFHGSPAAGTYTGGVGSGTIQGGRWAAFFRSGIVRLRVDGTSYGGSVAVKEQWGQALGGSGAYYEANHGTWRFSEQTFHRPHGAEFTALATGPDGSVYFAKRNQGWGPNNGHALFRPDGLSEPYTTIGKINATGQLQWLQDTDSIRELDDLGNYNDLTFPGDPAGAPSIGALAVDAAGAAYGAGRRNAAGASAFKVDTLGNPQWSANLCSATGTIREGCAAIDPTDGHVLFGGDRNDQWDGAASRDAHLWKLAKDTGEVVWHWDIREGVSALGVAASGTGKVFYTTDKVT